MRTLVISMKKNEYMPKITPIQSWNHLRDYCEKFRWPDPRTGIITEGYNPPSSVNKKDVERVPFFIRYITGKGRVESGYCVCLKVNRRRHQRMVQFVESQQIRIVRDYLVIEVNGTRFVTRSIIY